MQLAAVRLWEGCYFLCYHLEEGSAGKASRTVKLTIQVHETHKQYVQSHISAI
jgi:hypothetical protein